MINKAIEILNLILKEEPDALKNLMVNRCIVKSDTIINHPTITVQYANNTDTLSILGIINGIVGNDKERVAAYFNDDDGNLEKFGVYEINKEKHKFCT